MINTTENLLKISKNEELELMEELLSLADSLENDGKIVESQQVDDFLEYIKKGKMEKNSSMRDIKKVADFIQRLLGGNNSRIKRRLKDIAKQERKLPSPQNPDATLQDILHKQWNLDGTNRPAKDFSGEILGPDYKPGVLRSL